MNELLEPVNSIKGIGVETATTLHEMGIDTISDLLEHLPYRYEDYRLKDLETVEHEERVTIEGTIHSAPLLSYYGKKKSRLTLKVLIGRYLITVIFFNQPYLKSKLELGSTVYSYREMGPTSTNDYRIRVSYWYGHSIRKRV